LNNKREWVYTALVIVFCVLAITILYFLDVNEVIGTNTLFLASSAIVVISLLLVNEERNTSNDRRNFRIKCGGFALAIFLAIGIIMFVLRNNNIISESTLNLGLWLTTFIAIIVSAGLTEIADKRFPKKTATS